jgi:serine phosphatase RsbU (regulator of sigma subunit)
MTVGRTRLSLGVLCAVTATLPAAACAATPAVASSQALATVRRTSPIAIDLLPNLKVELPPVTVEAPLLPTIEVSSPKVEVELPKVEVSLPKVEVAPSQQQETPSTPTSSTPTPTPPPSSPPPAGGETSGASGAGAESGGEKKVAGASPVASAASVSNATPAGKAGGGRAAGPLTRSRASRAHRRPAPTIARSAAARSLLVSSTTARQATSSSSAGSAASKRATHASTRARAGANPLEALGGNIPIPLPVPDWSKPIILLLVIAALWFGARSRLADRRARRLEGQRDVLLADLSVMQATLVPVIPRRMGELAVSVAYCPADGPAAGGDFYDVFELESGKVAMILGDVAGHGHEAITQAALTRYTLRAYLQAGLEPRGALALAGSVLADAAAAHFATVAVAVYDGSSGTLTYAGAGHPPPIILGCDTPEPLTICCSPPVGWDVPTGRRQTTLSLAAGAVVCFFSDGLIEARVAGGLLGRERVAEMLAELGPRPSSSDLLERVQEGADSTPDDMVSCILAPQVGAAGIDSRTEELEVDATDLDSAGAGVERFLEACGVAAPQLATAVARAREMLIGADTVLLCVECPADGRPAAITVLRGLSAPIADDGGSAVPTLARDVATALVGRSAPTSGSTA